MRIGILETGQVSEDLIAEHGGYPEMFERLLTAVPDIDLELVVYHTMQGVPDSVDCDVYLITGSRFSVYDDLPWILPLVQFLERALDQGKKVLGICFGHQLMAHFFGGHVGPADVGWGVGVRSVDVLAKHPWMNPPLDSFALLCSHQDQVLELPKDAEVFAGSDFCPNAGYTVGDQVLTLQSHPEFTTGYCQALMTLRRETLLGEAVYLEGVDSLSIPTDEAILVRWMLNFVSR